MIKFDQKIRKFFRWWGRELAFLVPEKLQLIFKEKQGDLIIVPEAGAINLFYVIDQTTKDLGLLNLNEQGLAEYTILCEEYNELLSANVILRISREDGVSKMLNLPAAALENLHQVVTYELDKCTPFTADQVYFAVKVVEQEEPSELMKVLLVLTPREKLDSVCRELLEWGLAPVLADYAGAPNDLENELEYYNLLPDWARVKKNNLSQIINYCIAGLILVLLVAVMVMPVWMGSQTTMTLTEKTRQLNREAQVVETLRSEIDLLHDEANWIMEKKKALAPSVMIMDSLSKLINDDTWLTHFKYTEGKLQIQGQSPNASSLIGLLEASPLFDNVRFVSPVTQDKRTGRERFQVSAEIETQEDQGNGRR